MTSRKVANPSACPSRTAPKFVIRIREDLNEAVAALAESHHRSANSEMVQAIEAWLNNKDQLELLKTILSSRLDPAVAVMALSGPRLVPSKPETKFVVRLLEGQRESLAAEREARMAARAKDKSITRVCMNDVTNDILQWWVDINQDLKALFAACAKLKGGSKEALDVSVFMTSAA